MKISKIKIRNFRLLHDVEMRLEDGVTVVVGRNNCGKTSLSDVIRQGDESLKRRYVPADIDPVVLMTGRYQFGSNDLESFGH